MLSTMKLLLLGLTLIMSAVPDVSSAPNLSSRKHAEVGTINCTIAGLGKLILVPGDGSKATQLSLSQGGDSLQLVRSDGAGANTTAVDFYKCDSPQQGFVNTPDKMFGHLQMQGTGNCVTADYSQGLRTFNIDTDPCSLSDDSGQSLIFWSYAPSNGSAVIQFAGGPHDDSTPASYSYSFDKDGTLVAKGGENDGTYFSFN